MKKTVLLCILTLVAGFIIGLICNYTFILAGKAPARTTMSAAAASATPSPPPLNNLMPAATAAAPTAPPFDREDNTLLLGRAGEVLEAMKARDWAALGALVHPARGVTFTPYSTVDPATDLCFTARQVAELGTDAKSYIWGITDGKGDPIELTMADYLAQYVFNADYTQAPAIGVDMVIQSGNALENAADVFPDGRFVEYHFPGLDPKNEGFDWCSLKLVFEEYGGDWYLVGLIHSQWTT